MLNVWRSLVGECSAAKLINLGVCFHPQPPHTLGHSRAKKGEIRQDSDFSFDQSMAVYISL